MIGTAVRIEEQRNQVVTWAASEERNGEKNIEPAFRRQIRS